MPCCEARKLVDDCFDTYSSECIDSQKLSQIVANLTRENIAEREAERSRISHGRRQKNTLLLPDAEVDNVLGVTRNLCHLSQC